MFFSNVINEEIMSAGLTVTSFNQLLQYAIFSNIFGNTTSNKSKTMKETVSKLFKKILFLNSFLSTDGQKLII